MYKSYTLTSDCSKLWHLLQGNQKVTQLVLLTYVVKILEFRKSEATCNHKTFDFTYWGTFSAQNSEVFVQTDFFLFLADPWLFQKSAFKKIFKRHFSTRGAKASVETKLPWLVLTHHFVPCPKKIFSNNFKIFWKFSLNKNFWNFEILKNAFRHEMAMNRYSSILFGIIVVLQNFY